MSSKSEKKAVDAQGQSFGLSTFRYSTRALKMVWRTNARLTIFLTILSLIAGILPAGIAYLGKILVDTVVLAAQGNEAAKDEALWWLGAEMGLVTLRVGAQRAISVIRSLLRAELGHRVNMLVLRKAATLSLAEFEDAQFYDRLTRARREASSRPLSLVMRCFGIVQDSISLASYGVLLFVFSPLALLIVIAAAIPAFFTETKFSGQAFRLFRWRTPETRHQMYLETVLAREDYAKEVSLFGLSPLLLKRYDEIFETLYSEDRSLSLRRGFWGYVMELLSTAAFYGAYAWIVIETVNGNLTLGEMTMYVMIFRQAQSSFASILTAISGMYEDNLYLSNLYEYLEADVTVQSGDKTVGEFPGDGLRLENVWFRYPGAKTYALSDVSLHLPPDTSFALVGHNGSGKTTLVKLLTRLYEPEKGRILLDGTDLKQWQPQALRERIGVIFQDFARYQFIVGENIGVGNVAKFDDEQAWHQAATKGLADDFIEKLPEKYHTQLGRWFKDGRELSLGQWQKIALSRAFIRDGADILILDEPTASMDAEAEAKLFSHFQDLARGKLAITISHRFSTVRTADQIIVFHDGEVAEQGDHESLLGEDGIYANLFRTQAAGYL